MDERLVELIKSIRNRCLIFMYIYGLKELESSIPTILEDLYEDAQTIATDYCTKNDNEYKPASPSDCFYVVKDD